MVNNNEKKDAQNPQNITNPNWWEILWKINQLLIPFGLAWAIWVTSNIFEINAWKGKDERKFVLTDDIRLIELQIKDWTRQNFLSVDSVGQIKDIELSLKSVNAQLEALRLDIAKMQLTYFGEYKKERK